MVPTIQTGSARGIGVRHFYIHKAETPPGSEFLSLVVFSLYSRLLADFLCHLGKWVKLIKFEAENEFFCTWKVEKPQSTTSTP